MSSGGTRRWTRVAWLGLWLGTCAALAGCDGSVVEGAGAARSSGFQRLELQTLELGTPAEPRTLATFEPGDEPDLWEVRQGAARVSKGSPTERRAKLILEGEKLEDVVRRTDFDACGVNEIELEVANKEAAWLDVVLHVTGRGGRRSERLELHPSLRPRTLVARLLTPERTSAKCEAVELQFISTGTIELQRVSLVARPPSSLALAASTTPELVFLADEARRGVLLSSARSAWAPVSSLAPVELRFSYLEPPQTRVQSARSYLRVRVRDGDEELASASFDLEGGSDAPSQWHEAKLALPPLGSESRVELAVETDGEDAACAVAELALVRKPDARAAQSRPPSVLLVTSDTHRADTLGLTGGALATPALDALAARGVTFLDCFAACNSTNPSHVSLMTGESPRDTGVLSNQTRLADVAPTLAERFAELGYRTFAAISVRHLRPEVSGLGQGFDRVDVPIADEQRRAGATVDRALDWLNSAGDAPVFLWVHVFDAHAPYDPPPAFDREYYPKDKDPNDPALPEPNFPERVTLGPALPGLRDIEFPRAQYRAEVTYLDGEVRRLFDDPRFRSGVVAFVADHGESLGEHRIFFGHEGLYPQTIRVPLLVAWPEAPAGARVSRGVMHTDLARTLLDLAGAEAVAFPGRDLRRMLDAGADAEPRFVLGAHRVEASVTRGDRMLILYLQTLEGGPRVKARRRHSVELYDLARDPECQNDIARDEWAVASEMWGMLTTWLNEPRALGWDGGTSHDPGLVADLAKLGYAAADDVERELLWEDDDCGWCRKLRSP